MSEISCGFVRPAMAHTLNPPHDITIRKRDSNVEAAAGNYRIIPIEFPWGGKKKENEKNSNGLPVLFSFFPLPSGFPCVLFKSYPLLRNDV